MLVQLNEVGVRKNVQYLALELHEHWIFYELVSVNFQRNACNMPYVTNISM